MLVQGGFDPSNFNIGQVARDLNRHPGAQIGFIPTETALPCLVNTPRPYFFD
jgi:hypothetical protein